MVDGEEHRQSRSTGARYAWTHTYETEPAWMRTATQIVINSGDEACIPILAKMSTWTLRTQDVIHSYWVPAMRVKQDLLPGNPAILAAAPPISVSHPFASRARHIPAEYPIVCAELCGDGHGRMRGTVVVHEDESAVPRAILTSRPSTPSSIRRPTRFCAARLSFKKYICNSCHTPGQLWAGAATTGPSLNGIGDRAGERVARPIGRGIYCQLPVWNAAGFCRPRLYDEQMAVIRPRCHDGAANHHDRRKNFIRLSPSFAPSRRTIRLRFGKPDCTAIPEAIQDRLWPMTLISHLGMDGDLTDEIPDA